MKSPRNPEEVQKRLDYAKELKEQNPNITIHGLMTKVKEKFGMGLDFYNAKAIVTGNPPERKAVEAKSKPPSPSRSSVRVRTVQTTDERIQMVKDLLSKNPSITHTATHRALKEKFGVGMSDVKFKELKSSIASSPPTLRSVKNEMKVGTTPLHIAAKSFSRLLHDCGYQKAVISFQEGQPILDLEKLEVQRTEL